MSYDYIILGSGLGGLSAGLKLAKNHQKVLILEKNSLPGGLTSTLKRGRFEFDTGIYDFYNYGNSEKKGDIQNILNDYGIDIEVDEISFDAKIKVIDSQEELLFTGDVDTFFVELEKLKVGSADSLKEFLRVIKDIHDGFIELEKGNLNLEDEHPYFMKYIDMNVIDALLDLKMPKDTIHYLGYLWVSLGSPLDKLSFIDFAHFMYKLIFKKVSVLKRKNIDFILKMVNRYQDLNGKIFYHSHVTDITDKGLFKIITTSDGKEYKARKVICDLSKRYVYRELIKSQKKEVNQLENARTLSPNGVSVYLGLNKDCEFLGLKHYHYYEYQNMNSVVNVKGMNRIKHSTWEAIVPNVVNEFASPKNTTILVLRTIYFGDVFSKLSKENYQRVKEDIAKNLIEQFEEAFHIDITEYIEEIEILTPLDVAELTNRPNGSLMGYMRKGYDNAIHRLISYEDEVIPDIYFVGSSSIFGGGADDAIYSGNYIAQKLIAKEEANYDGK